MKFALFADLHLPAETGTITEEVLDWAICEAQRRGAEAIVGVGDLTNCGTVATARRLREKLSTAGLKYFLTPGNAELRSPAEAAEVVQMLATPVESQGLLLLDSSRGSLSRASQAMLLACKQKDLLAVTHYPLAALPAAEQQLLSQAATAGVIRRLISGHYHIDSRAGFAATIRGLDPDKAAGGAPAIVIYDSATGEEEVISYAAAEADRWPLSERRAFLNCLGISCMDKPEQALAFARQKQIRVCELRAGATAGCQSQLSLWRENVPDTLLSLHLPDFLPQAGDAERVREAVQLAITLGCARTTFHFPKVPPAKMQEESFRAGVKDATVRLLEPLAQAGIGIGLENLHTYPGRERTFGCTMAECEGWVAELATELPAVGFHFDLGHARNNQPFSLSENIANYFSRLGSVTNGIHLHQVALQSLGVMRNHQPFTEVFGKLIPMSSLFLAWQSRQIPREVPIILEIRGGGESSWQLLANYLNTAVPEGCS